MSSGPTLGLVGSNGKVETFQRDSDQNEKVPCLVAVSSMGSHNEEETKKSEATEPGSSAKCANLETEPEPAKKPRLTTTLLILKKPSDNTEDYVVANANTSFEEDLEEGVQVQRHHKKKKKKSKEKVLSMPKAKLQKLIEMQQSITKLTSKYRPSPFEQVDKRRRTQSTSLFPMSDTQCLQKSPPLSAPVLTQVPFFPGYKGKPVYRRRQISLGSNTDGKRRFTRKKRWESEEMKSSGVTTPTPESLKKIHLSENNVWSPMDDYKLLVNMTQTRGNLDFVFAGTKFSCFYTFDEVVQRWEVLLYDEKAGILSQTAINNLHPLVKAKIQSEALFSEEEENLLRTIRSVSGGAPELSCFTKLLKENPHIFYNRTARKLLLHWLDMKHFHLLDGQDVRDFKDPFNLFELKDSAYLASVPDTAIYQEIKTESKLVKRQIRQLEEEIESWQCMQELVVSDGTTDLHSIFSISEFDDQTYAILRGKQVRYCMRSKEILLGRHSTNNKVDADLTLEGASGKVSRRQAVVQMRDFGEFYLINQGRNPIFVDNNHVPYGAMTKLSDGCVIQITHIKLIFKINDKLLKMEVGNEIKNEILNARYKALDTFPTPTYSPVSAKAGAINGDSFAPPPTPRYTASPKKRISASASNSPDLNIGILSPQATPSQNVRPLGSSPSALGNFGTIPLPYISNDLTIRPTSQPSVMFPFVMDLGAKHQLSKAMITTSALPSNSDNDVFKKPAPVSVVKLSTAKATSTRTLSPSSSPSSSAFVAVSGVSSKVLTSTISTSSSTTTTIGDSTTATTVESPVHLP